MAHFLRLSKTKGKFSRTTFHMLAISLLKSFTINLSFNITFPIFLSKCFSHDLSFKIFLSQSFFHKFIFTNFLWQLSLQYFLCNVSFTFSLTKFYFQNFSFTNFVSQFFFHHLFLTIFFTIFIFNLTFSISSKCQRHRCLAAGLFQFSLVRQGKSSTRILTIFDMGWSKEKLTIDDAENGNDA